MVKVTDQTPAWLFILSSDMERFFYSASDAIEETKIHSIRHMISWTVKILSMMSIRHGKN